MLMFLLLKLAFVLCFSALVFVLFRIADRIMPPPESPCSSFETRRSLSLLDEFNKLWDSGKILDRYPEDGPPFDHFILLGLSSDDPRIIRYRSCINYIRGLLLHSKTLEEAKAKFADAKLKAAKFGQVFPSGEWAQAAIF